MTPINQNKSSGITPTDMPKNIMTAGGQFDLGTFDVAQFDTASGQTIDILTYQAKSVVILTDIVKSS